MSRFILVLLLVIAGCGGNAEKPDNALSDYSPVIIIQFRDIGISCSLPWDISSGRNNVSTSVLIPDLRDTLSDVSVPENSQIVSEALENNMFVALISDSCLDYEINRDHIQIWVDSSGNVRSHPEELLDEIPGTAWLNNTSRQDVLLGLFDMYKPDLILMVFRIPDVPSVIQMAEYWTAPDILSRYRIVLFSISEIPDTRGWCAFAGEGINGTTPSGITRSSLFTTIKLIVGLRWEDDLPDNVPALSIFENTNDIWSDQ